MSGPDEDSRLTTLFERHYDEVLAYCTRRIGRTEADDAVAEVFSVAWRRIDDIDWDTARPWLYGIARGVLANRWRALRRWRGLTSKASGLAPTGCDTPEVQVIRREQDREVIEALRSLKESDQEVLMLAAWEDLTAPEIAAALGISTSAADQRLRRAKVRLAKVLTPAPGGSSVSPRAAGEEGAR